MSLKAWPDRARLETYLAIPQGGAKAELADDVIEATVSWLATRTGFTEIEDVPANVSHACLIYAAKIYHRHKTVDGVAGSAQVGIMRIGRWDPDAESLLAPWLSVPHA